MFAKNPLLYLIKKSWQYAGKERPVMVLYGVLFLLAQAVSLIDPWVIGQILNIVQVDCAAKNAVPHKILNDIWFYLILYFSTQLGFWLFHLPARLLEQLVEFHIKANFNINLFNCLTSLPLQWHRDNHSGENIAKMNRAGNALTGFAGHSFLIIYMLSRVVGTLVLLFYLVPVAGWIALLTSSITFAVIVFLDRTLSNYYDGLNENDNFVSSAVHDYVTNIVSVITLRLEKRTLKELNRRISKALPLYNKTNFINESKWCLCSIMVACMIVIVLAWYTHSTLGAGHMIMAGTFFTLFEYLRRIGESFYNFCEFYSTVVRFDADVRSADTITDAVLQLPAHAGDEALPADWKHLAIRDLCFTYEDEKHRKHHLEEVNIDFERGKSYAFVGESGSGKSTMLSLLRGLQTPSRAQLTVDGQIQPRGLSRLFACTTLMPQEPEVFADSIRFNLAFGMEANDNELLSAVEAARFSQTLSRLPNGLDTSIAEKGVNLSGGEKQRLALARGIYFARESAIVLLDEPTSSVDPANERIIYTTLLEANRDKLFISAVHKLHLLELFDVICVFHNGRLLELGGFRELLTRGGLLAEVWQNYQTTINELSGAEENDPELDADSSLALQPTYRAGVPDKKAAVQKRRELSASKMFGKVTSRHSIER
jgi:ABC-type multidrug transport system fused ATPase/permease subunit